MRHNKKINHLGRKTAHRHAMLANMASSLILEKRIITTTAKAKALRLYVEPMITRSKDDSTTSRRVVFAQLQNKYAVTELFREVSQKVANRPGHPSNTCRGQRRYVHDSSITTRSTPTVRKPLKLPRQHVVVVRRKPKLRQRLKPNNNWRIVQLKIIETSFTASLFFVLKKILKTFQNSLDK